MEMKVFKKENLAEYVIDYVKSKILSGEYESGDHVPETEIAKELGISRAPVREGIRELQNLGVIKFFPRRGNFVSEIDAEDIKEIFDIRIMIEGDMVRILIEEQKLTDADFKHLENIVEDMLNISKMEGDMMEKAALMSMKDIEFHKYLWECSGSMRRKEILERLHFQLQMAMVYDTKQSGDLHLTAAEHYVIIEALKEGDVDACKKALKSHINVYSEIKSTS